MAGLKWLAFLLGLLALGTVRTEDCSPPSGLDSVPVISQFKSLFQWLGGDSGGAKCTQENFSKGAPVVSQIRSAVEAGQGDAEEAKKTQQFFLDNLVETAEATPGLGHVIGLGELAAGDKERGEATLKGSSRSTAVLIGGLAGGPGGAIAGGIAFDGLDSAIQGKPSGVIETIADIDKISKDPGKSFDAVVGTALDAFSAPSKGKGSGKKDGGDSGSKPTKKDGDDGGGSRPANNDGDGGTGSRPAGNDEGGTHPDGNTKIGSSTGGDVPMNLNDGPSLNHLSNNVINDNLRRVEDWERGFVNDLHLTDNCYFCTLAAIKRATVTEMMNTLSEMHIPGGAQLNRIMDLFKSAGFTDVVYQKFDNSHQLHNFMNDMIPNGETTQYGMAFERPGDIGHMVVLKAWKTTEGVLDYRQIDFQLDPHDPGRLTQSSLPGGTSFLFYIDADAAFAQQFEGLSIAGQAQKMNNKDRWIKLKQVALSGPIQTIGNKSMTVSTDFVENPNAELLRNGEKTMPIDQNVIFTVGCAAPAYMCGKKIVGYYTSWGTKYFTVYHAQRLTHVIFAFMKMNGDGTASDQLEDIELDRLKRLLNIAKTFTHLKVMFAVGGWENSQYFSAMASSQPGRQKFISSLIAIVDKWGFKGVDIDWEYPVTGGAHEGARSDKENYVQLMSELRQALDAKGPGFSISFASAAGQWTLQPGFDLPGMLEYADWVNVMTYDYFGAWESQWGTFTGPPAPLKFSAPSKWSGKLNVDWTMRYYACRIKDPNKIVMGVPFYGRYWKNVGPPYNESDGMWRLALAVNGKVEGGPAPFYELKEKYLKDSSFIRTYSNGAKAPYLWNPSKSIYVGYEDEESLQAKVDYAVSKNLGGIMIWAVDLDDDGLDLLKVVMKAPLCTSDNSVNYKCSPITDKRWWTWDDSKQNAGMCGKSAPLYKDYYPVCDPEDDGFSCCGAFGYCGSGPEICDCPTCVDYGNHPEKILEEPVKPTGPILWYLNNAPDGQRGRCGRSIPQINGDYPICNPDDPNAHCCSNGFYCGTGPGSCDCDGCLDFHKDPTYRFKEKTWFDWNDGPDKSGTCGESVAKINGKIAECDPDSKWPCCSEFGNCGSSDGHCKCTKCVDYRHK